MNMHFSARYQVIANRLQVTLKTLWVFLELKPTLMPPLLLSLISHRPSHTHARLDPAGSEAHLSHPLHVPLVSVPDFDKGPETAQASAAGCLVKRSMAARMQALVLWDLSRATEPGNR